ncbi:hypothetical protein [Hoeflea sp. BAL378]|nr:hypothetical protein [Hoeflea sp. BAL378]
MLVRNFTLICIVVAVFAILFSMLVNSTRRSARLPESFPVILVPVE